MSPETAEQKPEVPKEERLGPKSEASEKLSDLEQISNDLVEQEKVSRDRLAELSARFSRLAPNFEDLPESEQEELLKYREERIKLEDELRSWSPAQRKTEVLDYIRRGKQSDESIYFMPELIQLVPKLLDSNSIDFSAQAYDHGAVVSRITEVFYRVEHQIAEQDQLVKEKLSSWGVSALGSRYLEAGWYKKLYSTLIGYKKAIERPLHPKNPDYSQPEKAKEKIRTKFRSSLEKQVSGDLDSLLAAFEENPDSFDLKISTSLGNDPISDFLTENKPQEFIKYPRMTEYEGEVITEPPSLIDTPLKQNIQVVNRDQVPDVTGGIIIDGNFGYDSEGQLIEPEDKLIIDHHDLLNETRYDTATHMAGRFWENGVPMAMSVIKGKIQAELGAYRGENGKLITMVNHLDTDSVLSLWALRNPGKAKEHRKIINAISTAGDFLLGSKVLEHGATARDYDYIFRHYIDAAQEKIVTERLERRRDEVLDLHGELENQKFDIDQLMEERSNEVVIQEIRGLEQMRMQTIEENGTTTDPQLKRENGKEIGRLQKKIESLKSTIFAHEITANRNIESEQKELNSEIRKIDKQLSNPARIKTTNEEDAKVLLHLLDSVEDIVRNPFKYQRYLRQGRSLEQETIEQVDKDYREGTIEISVDEEDPDLLIIRPLKAKDLPRYESPDGFYFFLRRREDFNRPIVIRSQKNSYSMAINTQSMAGLMENDFNELLLAEKESKYISDTEQQLEESLSKDPSNHEKKDLEVKLGTVRADRLRNSRGQLWRNRTQMMFAFKSYIPEGEFLEEVRSWKKRQKQIK